VSPLRATVRAVACSVPDETGSRTDVFDPTSHDAFAANVVGDEVESVQGVEAAVERHHWTRTLGSWPSHVAQPIPRALGATAWDDCGTWYQAT
jgi:hypothetical protein